jgi:predicted KAP-like P-loop ATPase
VKGEVNAVDFIGIEALRVFEPAAYEIVRGNQDRFAGIGGPLSRYRGNDKALREFHESWLGRFRNQDQLRSLLLILFPELSIIWRNTVHGEESRAEWRQDLRICSPSVFPTYFRLTIPESGIGRAEIQAILDSSTDSTGFANNLRTLMGQRRPDGMSRARTFLESMEDLVPQLEQDRIEPMIRGLLAMGDELNLPGDAGGMFDFDNTIRVVRLFRKLLRRMGDAERERIVLALVETDAALCAALDVVRTLGNDHGMFTDKPARDDKLALVPRALVEQLGPKALERIRRSAQDSSFVFGLRRLRYLLAWWEELAGHDEPRDWLLRVTTDDAALLSALPAFARRIRSQSGYKMRERLVLDPQDLAHFFDVTALGTRLDELAGSDSLNDSERQLLEAFARARAARQRGEDPRSSDPFDDDEE